MILQQGIITPVSRLYTRSGGTCPDHEKAVHQPDRVNRGEFILSEPSESKGFTPVLRQALPMLRWSKTGGRFPWLLSLHNAMSILVQVPLRCL